MSPCSCIIVYGVIFVICWTIGHTQTLTTGERNIGNKPLANVRDKSARRPRSTPGTTNEDGRFYGHVSTWSTRPLALFNPTLIENDVNTMATRLDK